MVSTSTVGTWDGEKAKNEQYIARPYHEPGHHVSRFFLRVEQRKRRGDAGAPGMVQLQPFRCCRDARP